MKVAVFAGKFLPYSETFIFDELRCHRRYEAEVFAIRRMHADRFPFPDEKVHLGGWAYEWMNVAPRFARAIRGGGFALCHAHFGTQGTRAAKYARAAKLPLVITFHGFDVPLLTSWERFTPDYWRYAATARGALRDMTLGLCASDELRAMLVDYGVPEDKLVVWRLGIDLERFAFAARAPRDELDVIMIGRFVEKKGFAYGLRAFARHAGRARLTIVGDGPLDRALRALAARLHVADRVTFTGNLPPADVQARLATADVILCPSVVARTGDRESGLIVCKEASASGCVPIGTRHGGIPEIIDDGVTGLLVPERDEGALAAALDRLADPALRARMAIAGRAKMEREYDVRARVAALEDLYDDAIKRFGARS